MAEQKKTGRPSNGKPIILRIPATEETRNALETAAKAQRRSMAAYAGAVIEEALGTVSSAPQDEETPAGQKSGNGTTVLLTISLPPDLKAAVKAIAKVERRTASNMASLMIRDWIEQWEASHPGVSIWPDAEEE